MVKVLLLVVSLAILGLLGSRAVRAAMAYRVGRMDGERRSWALLERASAGKYAAASIVAGAEACSAAQELEHTIMLEAEAPTLPLPSCDVDQCTCYYRRLKDRRRRDRRAPERPEHRVLLGSLRSDRRASNDRRRKPSKQ